MSIILGSGASIKMLKIESSPEQFYFFEDVIVFDHEACPRRSLECQFSRVFFRFSFSFSYSSFSPSPTKSLLLSSEQLALDYQKIVDMSFWFHLTKEPSANCWNQIFSDYSCRLSNSVSQNFYSNYLWGGWALSYFSSIYA